MASTRTLALAIAATAIAGAALPATGVAAAGWAKLSSDSVSATDEATLLPAAGRILAAWPAGSGNGLATGIEFRGFAPTAANSLAGASAIAAGASGYGVVSSHPALIAGAGGPRLVFDADRTDGKSLMYLSGPLTEGASPAPPAELGNTITGTVDAVAASDGTPIVANDLAGSLGSQRGALVPPAVDFPIQAQLGGCCSYHPAVAADLAGGVWVAWYSNATGRVGIYVQGLDPATGAPLGAPTLAPQSATVANNTQRLAMVPNPAGGGVRLVYGSQTAAGANARLVSWSPGESAPVTVATPAYLGSAVFATAARRADGRLWVAWYDKGTTTANIGYYAKLGDARGAGGTAVALKQPAGTTRSGGITSTAVGNDLLVASVVDTGKSRAALWADVTPPVVINNPRTIRSGPATVVAPKGASIGGLKKNKCVQVSVTARGPSRVQVTIYSGTKSIRIFGQARVSFAAAGSKIVCVNVPFRAHTFDVRTPARIAVAAKTGARATKGEKPAAVTTRSFKFFK